MPGSGLTAGAKLSRILEYQRALASFSRVTSESIAPERLMHHACAQISLITHIKHAKILRYRPESGDLLVVAGVGWKADVVGTATLSADSHSPPGRSIQTAAPVVIEDLPNDQEFRLSALLRDHGIVSVLNVPILTDGRNWGVLEVDADKPRAFDEGEVEFLTTMANMIGSAMSRHEVEQRAVRAAQKHEKAEGAWKTLVRELQHRTKNNLQTVVSFLSLQRRGATNDDDKKRFESVINRINAIALVHDQLSLNDSVSQVEFADYLRSLCANIDPHNGYVSIEVQASPAAIPLDRAVPAGLIVNELVTNALKYAFDEMQEGLIRVFFDTNSQTGEACIQVEDNGKGMGVPREGGLGLTLMKAFAQQLGGRIERDSVAKGTLTRVSFPLAM